jgi:hypothetical protein
VWGWRQAYSTIKLFPKGRAVSPITDHAAPSLPSSQRPDLIYLLLINVVEETGYSSYSYMILGLNLIMFESIRGK